jgi:Concanavalin A-like lectin/glucanases superfamily
MSPNARRDLVVGGILFVVGAVLLGFAFFAGDEGFRAPRWVVGAVAIGCMLGGAVPLRAALSEDDVLPQGPFASLAAAGILLIFAAIAMWILVAVGPEGTAVTLNVPLPISEDAERWLKNVLFHGLLGLVAFLCLAGAVYAAKSALPSLGRTALVAIVAPIVGLAAWVVLQFYTQAPHVRPPVVFLSFDRRFPGDEYLAHSHGKEIVARPGRVGMGLFVGGNGDWLDVEAPRGYDTRNGLTLEFWMKRESWINPMAKGSRAQTITSVELERDWKGHPEIQEVAFSMELSVPRELSAPRELGAPRERARDRDLRPENYIFRPQARVGEVRLQPSRSMAIAANRWTHVAIVYDRFLFERMRLYLDGHPVARAVPWGSALGFADLRTIRIGTRHEQSGAFRGMVDEVKLYARALSDEEILASAARGS